MNKEDRVFGYNNPLFGISRETVHRANLIYCHLSGDKYLVLKNRYGSYNKVVNYSTINKMIRRAQKET